MVRQIRRDGRQVGRHGRIDNLTDRRRWTNQAVRNREMKGTLHSSALEMYNMQIKLSGGRIHAILTARMKFQPPMILSLSFFFNMKESKRTTTTGGCIAILIPNGNHWY